LRRMTEPNEADRTEILSPHVVAMGQAAVKTG
jgi:hypothetical protein